MTEAEWNAGTDPQPMLEFLRAGASDRKLRLFAVACCRRILHLLNVDYCRSSRGAVDLLERRAEGISGDHEMRRLAQQVSSDAMDAAHIIGRPDEADFYAVSCAAEAVESACLMNAANTARTSARAIAYAALALNGIETYEGVVTAWSVGSPEWSPKAPYKRKAPFRSWEGDWRTGEEAVRNQPDFIGAYDTERAAECRLLRDLLGNPFRPVTLDPAWRTATVNQLAEGIYEEKAFDRMPILGDALEEAGCSNADILNHCRQPGEHAKGCWVVDLLLGKK